MSFLFSMFGKSNKEQLSKYDRITFKINLSEHIPQYYEATSNKAITETEITPDHPLYYEIFPKKEEPKDDSYIEYTVKNNDTLLGIAMRLDIGEQYLKNLNGMTSNIYPGMTIRLPKGTDLQKLDDPTQPQHPQRLRISQLLTSTQKPSISLTYKYTVFYFAGPSGDIKGILTVNSNYIIFNPDIQGEENLAKFTVEKLLKFNVLVEMADIQKAECMRIPLIQEFSSDGEPKFNNIVQFMLFKVGNLKIEKKYKQRLKQLKLNNKAIASISFSFRNPIESLAKKQCHQLTQNINKLIESQEHESDDENKKRLTNIPFFDIINDKSMEHQHGKKEEQQHILGKNMVCGNLTEDSDILTTEHFQGLVKKFPLLYRLYSWQKVFSARRDGSAFNTFLNKTKDVQPAIFLLKQYKGNILGAFLVQSIQAGKTGRGEMFIFTFRGDSKQPELYEWTTQNDFFVYLEKDQGLGIGMGIKYGIFMDRKLEKGFSSPTKTFGNTEKLSVNEDFLIDEVEVWGVDNSF